MDDSKVAIVTGASGGIGASCAFALSRAGYIVILHYNKGEKRIAQLQGELPFESHSISADLSSRNGCEYLIEQTLKRYNRIDVLVNNAGITLNKHIFFTDKEDICLLMNTNFNSVVLLTKYAVKSMIKQKQGRIINISTVSAYTGNKGLSLYTASKAAMQAFSKSVALDVAKYNILVNVIAPGAITTPMTDNLNAKLQDSIRCKIPLGRWGEPREVSSVVAFLASENSSYITGSTIHVNGGMYMA